MQYSTHIYWHRNVLLHSLALIQHTYEIRPLSVGRRIPSIVVVDEEGQNCEESKMFIKRVNHL